MKKGLLIIVLFFGVIASLSATTHTVTIANYSFPPVTIVVGDQIMWVNNTGTTHTATSGSNCTADNKFNSGDIPNGSSYTSPVGTFTSSGTVNYYCTYHCAAPFNMTGTITVTAATGIFNPRPTSATLNVFPNPFTDVVTLSVEQGKSNVNMIKVTDALGKEVKNIEVSAGQNSYSFDLSDLQPGMYFCNLYTSDGIIETRKIFRSK
jgi:plastocyanin